MFYKIIIVRYALLHFYLFFIFAFFRFVFYIIFLLLLLLFIYYPYCWFLCLTSFDCRRRQSIYLLKCTDTVANITFIHRTFIRNLPKSLSMPMLFIVDVAVVVLSYIYAHWAHTEASIIIAACLYYNISSHFDIQVHTRKS